MKLNVWLLGVHLIICPVQLGSRKMLLGKMVIWLFHLVIYFVLFIL